MDHAMVIQRITLASLPEAVVEEIHWGFRDEFKNSQFFDLPYEVGLLDPSNSNLFYSYAVVRLAVEVVKRGYFIEVFDLNGSALLTPGVDIEEALSLIPAEDRWLAELIVADNQRQLDFRNAFDSYSAARGDSGSRHESGLIVRFA